MNFTTDWFCYKELHRKSKHAFLFSNLLSAFLVEAGTIAGGITLNPIVLGVISGGGVLLKTAAEIKNYKGRIEKSEFAFSTYEKTLSELRSFLRGEKYDSEAFIAKMKVLVEVSIDLSLDQEKYSGKYSRIHEKSHIGENEWRKRSASQSRFEVLKKIF